MTSATWVARILSPFSRSRTRMQTDYPPNDLTDQETARNECCPHNWNALYAGNPSLCSRIETRPLLCPFTCPAMPPLPNPCRIVHPHRRTLSPSNDIDRVPRMSFFCSFVYSPSPSPPCGSLSIYPRADARTVISRGLKGPWSW